MGCSASGATGRRGDSTRKPRASATQLKVAMVPSGRGKLYEPDMTWVPSSAAEPTMDCEIPLSASNSCLKLAPSMGSDSSLRMATGSSSNWGRAAVKATRAAKM
ncbi:unnamed protein product, partial [Meganyctiphanes norvegica]